MAHVIIDDLTPTISYQVGASARSVFPVPFAYFEASNLAVKVALDTLTLGVDYSVAGTAAGGGFSSGTVTLDTAVSDVTVTLERLLPIERVVDFPNSGPFDIPALNTQFDKLVAICQQLKLQIDAVATLVSGWIATISAALTTDVVTVNFPTNAALELATVSVLTLYARTAGYYEEGDGGGALYKRVSAEPSHFFKRKTANDVWFELRESEPSLLQFGGKIAPFDNSSLVEAAAVYCDAKGVGMLKLPAGTLEMSATIAVAGLAIVGQGKRTVLVNNSTGAAAITFGDGTNVYSGNALRDVVVAQSASVAPNGTTNKGLWLRKQHNFILENVYATQFPNALTDAFVADECYELHVRVIIADHADRDGIYVGNSSNIFLWDSQVSACGRNGVSLIDNAGVHCNRVESIQNFKGWVINSISGVQQQDYFMHQCLGDGNVSHNWEIGGLATGRFTACWGCTQKDNTTVPDARGWYIYGSKTANLHFIGCAGNNNNGDGWSVLDIGTGMPDELYWTDCELGNNDQTPYLGTPAMRGNGKGGTGYGISIANSTKRFSIRGGVALNNATAATNFGTQTKLTIEGLAGYNPVGVAALTIGASPFTFTNGPTRSTVSIGGGAVTTIAVDGTPWATASNITVPLEPNQVMVVTHTIAPGATISRH